MLLDWSCLRWPRVGNRRESSHESRFPGDGPNACLRQISKVKDGRLGCSSTGRKNSRRSSRFHWHLQMSRTNQRLMFQPPRLTVKSVFGRLKEIAKMTGNAVRDKRVDWLSFHSKESATRWMSSWLGATTAPVNEPDVTADFCSPAMTKRRSNSGLFARYGFRRDFCLVTLQQPYLWLIN